MKPMEIKLRECLATDAQEVLETMMKEALAKRHIQELINRLNAYEVQDLQDCVAIESAIQLLEEGQAQVGKLTDCEELTKQADAIYNTCRNYLSAGLPVLSFPTTIKLR